MDSVTPRLQVTDLVSYTDQHSTRTGKVIEIDVKAQRARIQWDQKKPRTWIRIRALVKKTIDTNETNA